MKVKDLITYLQTQPEDIQVAYRLWSEQCLLELEHLKVEELCEPRSDGWIQDKRIDIPTQMYLVFPGN